MSRPYSLGNPADGHSPTIGREALGRTWNNGRTYATTLRCSCGWNAGRVTNLAPSAGGRPYAQEAYRSHLMDCGVIYAGV